MTVTPYVRPKMQMPSKKLAWTAGLVAVVALTGTGCGSKEMAPGSVLSYWSAEVTGTSKSVTLPTGVVTVTFEKRREHLAGINAGDNEAHDAQDGTEFAPVHIAFARVADEPPSPKRASVVISAAGKSVKLRGPYDLDGNIVTRHDTSAVVVVSKAEPVRISVTYDGKTQSVSSSG